MPVLTFGWNDTLKNQCNTNNTKGSEDTARIIGVGKNLFILSDGKNDYTATLSGKLIYSGEDYPVTGDWVTVKKDPDASSGVITGIIKRKNVLTRKASGTAGKRSGSHESAQVIAANVDICLIVTGLDRDYSLRRIERYLTLVYNCGAQPVVILNKSDLCPDPDIYQAEVESIAFGVPVHTLCATGTAGVEIIRNYLTPGTTAVLLGSSGAGKSTIVNALFGDAIQKTRETATTSGKGVHTTTSRDLIHLPGGAMIIDNPGIREVGLWHDGEGIQTSFSDVEALAEECRFNDCKHHNEPGCNVIKALNSGKLDHGRYTSYLKQIRELDYLESRSKYSSAAIEKRKWKGVAKKVKSLKNK